jgi:hypothetical protein
VHQRNLITKAQAKLFSALFGGGEVAFVAFLY